MMVYHAIEIPMFNGENPYESPQNPTNSHETPDWNHQVTVADDRSAPRAEVWRPRYLHLAKWESPKMAAVYDGTYH